MIPKIEFDKVSKTFSIKDPGKASGKPSRFTALDEISFSVRAGEFLVIVGPSGCGKSTLLDLLGGLSAPCSGRILLDGKPITGPAMDRGLVFQQYALYPWRTALGNVEFGLEVKGIPERQRREIAHRYLSLVGLDGFEHRHPHELSGGMKQRVAIARSLAYDPEVLMMDEPFAALDAQTRETLQGELVRIWQASQKTIIFITHGIDEAVALGQRVAVMTSRPGRIKTFIDVPPELRHTEDVRSHPDFVAIRQQVSSALRDEVRRAQELERKHRLNGASTPGVAREVAAHA